MPQMPFYFFGKSYWRPLIKVFENKMHPMGMISRQDMKIYKLTDDIREIVHAANKIGHPKIKSNFYDGFSAQAGMAELKDNLFD